MKVYSVMRKWGRGHRGGEWHVYKLFDRKKAAQAWVDAKNPNACAYDYEVRTMKVESSLPKPPAM